MDSDYEDDITCVYEFAWIEKVSSTWVRELIMLSINNITKIIFKINNDLF